MRAIDGLREISTILGRCGIEHPHREAEIIFEKFLEVDRVTYYRDNPVLSGTQLRGIEQVIERRQRREPLQYIIGHVDFYGLKIHVGPGVLIPRPETEFIVGEAVKAVNRGPSGDEEHTARFTSRGLGILDLCTGSGCLALALAKEFPDAEVFGTDISERAVEYAMLNAGVNGIRNATFMRGDLFEPVRGMRFDIIVANPPYIRREEIPALQPEIQGWEPVEALDGGEDGLMFYRKILSLSPEYLVAGGSIVMEVGQGEADDVLAIAERAGLRIISVARDYSGVERVLRLSSR